MSTSDPELRSKVSQLKDSGKEEHDSIRVMSESEKAEKYRKLSEPRMVIDKKDKSNW
jgi:hypothetical protein